MKATEKHFPVVLLTMLHKAVLTSKSVHEILLFDHLNESQCAVLSCGTVSLVSRSVFLDCRPNSMMLSFESNLSTSTFTWYALFVSTEKKIDFFFNFDSVPFGSEREKKGCSLLVVSIQSVECQTRAAKAGLETTQMEQQQQFHSFANSICFSQYATILRNCYRT